MSCWSNWRKMLDFKYRFIVFKYRFALRAKRYLSFSNIVLLSARTILSFLFGLRISFWSEKPQTTNIVSNIVLKRRERYWRIRVTCSDPGCRAFFSASSLVQSESRYPKGQEALPSFLLGLFTSSEWKTVPKRLGSAAALSSWSLAEWKAVPQRLGSAAALSS